MKAIQLTEEHKKKLLEMCEKLFPEYDVEMFHNGIEYDIDKYLIDIRYKKEKLQIFHWFEFCYGPLLSAIFNHINYPRKVAWYDDTNGRVEFGNKFTWYNEEAGHPVTFLYEEFLKLKL